MGKQEPISKNRCPKCDRAFSTSQGIRRHYVSMHEGMHLSNIYAATDTCPACMVRFWTRYRTVTHLNNSEICLFLARGYTQPYGRMQEVATGTELKELHRRKKFRLHGPLRRQCQPNGRILYRAPPPPPPCYFTPEEIEACISPKEESVDTTYYTPEDVRHHPARENIKDITPFLGPIRVILLLYGGRRRHGDVACYAEMAHRSFTGRGMQSRVCVCVIDLVHGSHHDISRGATDFWEPQIKGGRVAAIGAAPPCETCAIARWSDGGWHDRQSPVPLRTAKSLWGRTVLTAREARQLRTANVLLFYTIKYATMAAVLGLPMWIEHPDHTRMHIEKGTPDDPRAGAPSIWLSEFLQRLRAFPCTYHHSVLHRQFAGKATKPTRPFSYSHAYF